MAENSVSCSARRKYYNLTQTQIIKSLAVQRLKNIELEEQCIHHLDLTKYLVPMTMSILWITSFGKLTKRPKGKNCKSRSMQGVINKEWHVIFGQFGIKNPC